MGAGALGGTPHPPIETQSHLTGPVPLIET